MCVCVSTTLYLGVGENSSTCYLHTQHWVNLRVSAEEHVVSVFGPSAWNDLPLPLRQKPSLDSFKSNLKTFPFPKTTDQPCFLFWAAVFLHLFIRLKSLFAACFKMCVNSVLHSQYAGVCGCLCVRACMYVCA